MATKKDLLKWIPGNDPAKITDPGTAKRAGGLLYKEKPAFQFLNWLFNLIDKWLLGLQGSYYDIVIGSAAQVTNNEATHEIDDLDDALAVAGSRVLILDGTHTLTGNLSLSNDDLKVTSESPLAILDVATFTATFSGARNDIKLRVSNSGAGDIIVTGVGSFFFGIDTPITSVVIGTGSRAETTGASGGQRPNGVVGEIKTFPYSTLEHGFIACNGTSYDTTVKAALFAKIGYDYGGSGSNFNVPDYEGEFFRSTDNGSGRDPDAGSRTDRGDGTTGDAVGTRQADDFKAHTHEALDTSSGSIAAGGGVAAPLGVTGATGGNETRGRNVNVFRAICDGT